MVEKSQITRAERGRVKAEKRRKKREAREAAQQREQSIQESLASPKRTLRDDVIACLPPGINHRERDSFVDFYCEVAEKAPRLVSERWGAPLHALKASALGVSVIVPNTLGRAILRHPELAEGIGYDFWLEAAIAAMERCDALLLCPGWEKSSGVAKEIERANKLGIAVLYSLDELAYWLKNAD
jgi:hypothetical protein